MLVAMATLLGMPPTSVTLSFYAKDFMFYAHVA